MKEKKKVKKINGFAIDKLHRFFENDPKIFIAYLHKIHPPQRPTNHDPKYKKVLAKIVTISSQKSAFRWKLTFEWM